MKTAGSVGWCAIVALLLGLSAVTWLGGRRAKRAPAAAEGGCEIAAAMCRCGGESSSAVDADQTSARPNHSSRPAWSSPKSRSKTSSIFCRTNMRFRSDLDVPALEDAGLTADEPITINLQNISLRSALRLLLKTKQSDLHHTRLKCSSSRRPRRQKRS